MKYYIENKSRVCLCLGLLFITLAMLPYMILGEDSLIQYHDQLDGEVVGNIYQAKYLFSESDVILEFMNGTEKSSLIPTMPLAVLSYAVLPPFWAFVAIQGLVMIIAFVGMFYCMRKVIENEEISFLVAIVFACLPINAIYGFVLWIPMGIICFYQLYKGKYIIAALLGVIFYGGASSLVAIGYVCIAFTILTLFWLLYKDKKLPKFFLLGIIALTLTYIIINIDLILQVLGLVEGFVAHREEMILNSQPFWSTFWNQLIVGGEHILDYHGPILLLSTIVLLVGGVGIYHKKFTEQYKKLYHLLAFLYILNILIALFVAFWRCEAIVALRTQIGGVFVSFQLDRFYWITPTFWYLMLGISLLFVFCGLKNRSKTKLLVMVFASLIFLAVTVLVLKESHMRRNFQVVLNREYASISWKDYYAEDLFDEIDEFIGRDKEGYRVVSLGMPPATALYNGFYCLDGYSNNYPLSYKHEFREIIENELEKNDYIRGRFDDWGNRCYLFSAEDVGYFMQEKGTFYYQNLDLNTDKLAQMGGEYLFSASYIVNAEDNDLVLLREEPFETEDSYWNVYVYQVVK